MLRATNLEPDFNKYIHDTNNPYGQTNANTKAMYQENNMNYETWIKPSKENEVHFVSKDNDDISDPANKFYQAVKQLVEWNKAQQLDTLAIQTFEKICAEQSYPGLGVVKKLSLMHHLELVGRYLDGKI